MFIREFAGVSIAFEKMLKNQPSGAASQLVVHYQGKEVVNLAGGRSGSSFVNSDTPFLTFSVSKTFTAAAIWRLIGEGALELDAPVGRYWPEYARNGKESTTLRHVLLHQAGIPAPHLERQIFTWPYWNLVIRDLEHEKAEYIPGTKSIYHLVNFGFILGEIVRRVTGEPIDQYLSRYFFEPMGLLHTWMRIPLIMSRQSPRLVTSSLTMETVVKWFNLQTIRCALIPAAGLHSTASELSAFFQMLLDGGQYGGRQYLKPEIISLAARSYFDGYDPYIKCFTNWGLGLIMGGGLHVDPDPDKNPLGYGSGPETFSALGMGTCMVWADPPSKLVVAFTTNAMLAEHDTGRRWAALSNAVWDCWHDLNSSGNSINRAAQSEQRSVVEHISP